MHVPVLLEESVEILDLHPGQFAIDGTLGEGGHAREILKKISPGGMFLGFDRDKEAIERFKGIAKAYDSKVFLENENFRNMPQILGGKKLGRAQALLLDLGFASGQLESGKGFSFMKREEPLIMTYSDKEKPLYEILPKLVEREIVKILKEFGDERYAEKIGQAIYSRERRSPIKRVGELVEVIQKAAPGNYERGRINPATRTFMAFRIFINDELGALEELLMNLPRILAPNGRGAIISYHSNEDRLIKQSFKSLEEEGLAEILTKKVIKPSWEEVKKNPRSRSAKLRAIRIK